MSSVSALLDDAERIATQFVPPLNTLGPVVGVLIKQVEALAGKELVKLTDEQLGVTPAPTPTVEQTVVADVSDDTKGLLERLASLESQLAAAQAKPTPVVTEVPSPQTPAVTDPGQPQ